MRWRMGSASSAALLSEISIFRLGTFQRGPALEARDIVGQFFPFRDQLEHRPPADVGTHHHVRSSELLAHEVWSRRHRLAQDIHYPLEIAVTEDAGARL